MHPISSFLVLWRRRSIGLGMGLLLGISSPAFSVEPAAPSPTLLEQAFTLDEGKTVKRDAAAAARLYAQAAAQGDAAAHLRLGYMTETGDGVPQDYNAARAHYEVAVKAGLAAARVRLAICHLEGWGGPVDRPAFVRELTLAGEAGDKDAQTMLGWIYSGGFAVPMDRAAAVKWMERAARHGDADAEYLSGQLAEKRVEQLQPNVEVARHWYELSAEKEYQTSMRAMARTFFSGTASGQDQTLGLRWLELAYEAGDTEAAYMLAAEQMLNPAHATPDATKVRAWLKFAAERRHLRAKEVLQAESGGKSLRESLLYVLQNPYEERYVQTASQKVDLNAATHRPVPYRVVNPTFPRTLRLSGISGNVLVDFTVDTTGRVQDPKVVETAHPLFSEQAIEAVEQWRFYPGKKDGRLVNVRMRIPMKFEFSAEQLQGVDEVLVWAGSKAEEMGSIPKADYQELRYGGNVVVPVLPRMSTGGRWPEKLQAVVLLVIDAAGKPLRGYTLMMEPKEVGDEVLNLFLLGTYPPRLIDGKPAQTNLVLTFKLPEGAKARADGP